MDNKKAKTILDYATNNVAYPKNGKDIDFMGGLPQDLKKVFPKSATSIGPGSGRGRGDAVLGSGPGGAAATQMKVRDIASRIGAGEGDASDNAKNFVNAAAVDAQQRSINQLKQVRKIYQNAFDAVGPNKVKKKQYSNSPSS